MTPEFESRLKKAVEDGTLPHAVLLARDRSGKMDYSFSVGPASLQPGAPPITPSTPLRMASLSKLLTSLAVLRLIERGLLALETDVAPYLPVLAAQPILTGFDETTGEPLLTPRTKPILVRHLLTHTAGTGYPYPMSDDRVPRFLKAASRPLPIPFRSSANGGGGTTVATRFDYPLLFEPGQSWLYGGATDWAGRLVEVVSGESLDEYVHTHVLAPVGVPRGGITFYFDRAGTPKAAGAGAVAGMSQRDEDSGKLLHQEVEPDAERDAFGGEGAVGGMQEYMKVMYSIMTDDGKILKPETARLLFEPLVKEPKVKEALGANMKEWWTIGVVPPEGEYSWSAGGLLWEGGKHEYRTKGFLQWGGAWNLYWFIDRNAGVCGLFGTQVYPPADPLVKPFMAEFEDTIYAEL